MLWLISCIIKGISSIFEIWASLINGDNRGIFRTSFCVPLSTEFKMTIDGYFPSFQDCEASGRDKRSSKVYGEIWPVFLLTGRKSALGRIAHYTVRAYLGTPEYVRCVSNSTTQDLVVATYCFVITARYHRRAALGIAPRPALSVRWSLPMTMHIASPIVCVTYMILPLLS